MGNEGSPSMTVQTMKQTIRQRIMAGREQLPATLRARFSAEISGRIVQLARYRTAHTVLGYMNFGAEFNTDHFVRQALADGKQLLLPRVNRATKELDVYRVTDLQHDLAPGMWGIREPIPERCERVDALKQVDFILLPGVAFGLDGARLGYGGGFYDKLLARMTHHAALVAAAFSMQLVEGIPQEVTDRKVHWLVTEHETIHCAA